MLWYKELEMSLEDIVTMLSAFFHVDKSVAWKKIESIAFYKNIEYDGENNEEVL